LSTKAEDSARATGTAHPVDHTDWLKATAIILVSVDHFGYFFMENDLWWSVFGRLAAPPFFFLLGYARTRTVPLRWIGLGVILTLLDMGNAGWRWEAPNILLSFTLIRMARPHVESLLMRHGWIAFGVLTALLIAALPVAGPIVDYGAEGWLWALFGLCQRSYVDSRSASPERAASTHAGPMRVLACLVAAILYVWQEQGEYSFPPICLAVVVLGVGVLSAGLLLFQRGPSHPQPPEPISGVLRFLGRHTLEIYAIQLAGSELIIMWIPALAP
jgi:hypothetical protein